MNKLAHNGVDTRNYLLWIERCYKLQSVKYTSNYTRINLQCYVKKQNTMAKKNKHICCQVKMVSSNMDILNRISYILQTLLLGTFCWDESCIFIYCSIDGIVTAGNADVLISSGCIIHLLYDLTTFPYHFVLDLKTLHTGSIRKLSENIPIMHPWTSFFLHV